MKRPFPILKTERLLLRQLTLEDVIDLSSLRSDPLVNKYLGRPDLCTVEEAVVFVEKINQGYEAGKNYYWAICELNDADFYGTICLWNFSQDGRRAEIGYELNRQSQGRGYMNEALRHVIDYSRSVLKLNELEAYTHRENAPSLTLLKRFGFKINRAKRDIDNTDNVIFVLSFNE